MLEEQRTIATTCQRAVDDVTARCKQLESEKDDLQAELASRRSQRNATSSESGAVTPGSAGAQAAGGQSSLSSSSQPLLSNQSDQVKFELWRLQRENVQLRQRIYQQLAGREQQEDSSHGELLENAAGSNQISSTKPSECPSVSSPLSIPPATKVSSLTRASTRKRILNDPRRRPVALDAFATMPAMKLGAHESPSVPKKNSDDLSGPPSHGKSDVQSSFMVDLHVGSRRDLNDEEKQVGRINCLSHSLCRVACDGIAVVPFFDYSPESSVSFVVLCKR